jgi:hypothetical protein
LGIASERQKKSAAGRGTGARGDWIDYQRTLIKVSKIMQASKVELGVISELNNLPPLKTHAAVENVVVDVAEGTDVDHERNSSLQEPAELDDQEPLTPIGRMFLEPDLYLCGLCTIGFQNLIDLEELKHTLRNTLVKHKRFSSVVVGRRGVSSPYKGFRFFGSMTRGSSGGICDIMCLGCLL